MKSLFSRANVEVAGSLGIVALAAVIVLLSGIVFFPLILLTLLSVAIAFDGGFWIRSGGLILGMAIFLWSAIAAMIAIHNAAEGLSLMNNPTWRGLLLLSSLSVAIAATCPFLWMPWQ